MKNPRVVLYLRVSTVAQDFDAQRHAVTGYCRRRGWRPLQTYQEKKPGASAPRTELDRMMQDARAGKFDVIVIYKLDRLGRSSVHLGQLLEELTKLRIWLVSVNEGVDTGDQNPMAQAIVKIISVVAEMDRARIRERSADGLKAAKARGQKLGRPRVDKKKIEAVRLLALEKDTFQQFRSVRSIAAACRVSVGTAAPIIKAARAAFEKSPPEKVRLAP